MRSKTHMSDKSKKILTGVGIGFGTVMVFIVSFIAAFTLIVNPINFFTVSDADTVQENEKLRSEVQSLNDRIEHLNTTVDKYKAAANAPAVNNVPATVTTPVPKPETNTNEEAAAPKPEEEEPPKSDDGGETEAEGGTEFSPDTVNTTAEQTPEDVEVPITVIDISE